MELCDASLNDSIFPIGLEYSEFIRVCQFLCTVEKYLRQINIIHRDIKPENILTKTLNDGQIIYKLGDFGAARLLKENKQYKSLHGTEAYVHPDIYAKLYEKGLDNVDPNVLFDATHELWSIGATLYAVATGQVPFEPKKGMKDFKTMYAMTTQKKQSYRCNRAGNRPNKMFDMPA